MMNFEALDAFLSEMPRRGIPACELAVTVDGETVYRKCVGYSDAKGTKPTAPSDLYWIFSATKIVTCIAAMRLVEEGKIALDDPVSKYIPEYADVTVQVKNETPIPAKTVLTVKHLFTMTSGMTYDLKTPNILGATDRSTLGLVRAMAKDPLRFEPGTHYRYSLSHDVLAAVVEVASGKRFSEYLDEIIFRPLGIRDMGFCPNEEQKARFSEMYTFKSGAGFSVEKTLSNAYRLSEDYESGGAGLFASVDEYVKIISVIACGGTTKDGYTLLRPETIAMMRKNRLSGDAWNDFVANRQAGYGFGLCGRVHVDPTRSGALSPVGEFGWDGAAGAYVLIDPDHRIAIYYGQHIMGCSYIYYLAHPRIRDMVYEALGFGKPSECAVSEVVGNAEMPYPRLCAHRGFNTVAPENSLPAFGAAVALGAEEIEFDLWATKDGEIVSCHDSTLDRVSDGTGKVYDHTYEELCALDFGVKFGEKFKGLRIVRFEDILRKLGKRVVMNIHVKTRSDEYDDGAMKKIVALIRKYDCAKHVYFMISHDGVIRRFMEYAPDIPVCVGHRKEVAWEIVDRAIALGAKKVQLFKPYFNKEMVEKAHANGILCNVFYADDPEEAKSYLEMGIDTILTNDYLTIKNALGL